MERSEREREARKLRGKYANGKLKTTKRRLHGAGHESMEMRPTAADNDGDVNTQHNCKLHIRRVVLRETISVHLPKHLHFLFVFIFVLQCVACFT